MPMKCVVGYVTNLARQVEGDGWYHNGTWAKVRVIMKAKIVHILAGKGKPKDSDFAQIAAMPESIDKDTKQQAIIKRGEGTAQEIEWATAVRNMAAFAGWGQLKNGLTAAPASLSLEGRTEKDLSQDIDPATMDPGMTAASYIPRTRKLQSIGGQEGAESTDPSGGTLCIDVYNEGSDSSVAEELDGSDSEVDGLESS